MSFLYGLCGCNPIPDSLTSHFSDTASPFVHGLVADYIDGGRGNAAPIRCGDRLPAQARVTKATSRVLRFVRKDTHHTAPFA